MRIILLLLALLPALLWAEPLDRDTALARSQAAIGQTLQTHVLHDRHGQPVALDQILDRPTVISLIYTSCHHTCPLTTRHLARAVRDARDVLGEDSFHVITIGFDTAHDDAEAMRNFARAQDVDDAGWYFLSGTAETLASLVDELGFTYQPSPHGFDHLTQATVVQAGGVVYRQVYGELFELPWLVEPLKDLVFGRAPGDDHLLSDLMSRIRLFCTVFDPKSGRYEFDYSLFIQIAIGALIVLSVFSYLIHEALRARRRRVG